MQFNYWKNHWN